LRRNLLLSYEHRSSPALRGTKVRLWEKTASKVEGDQIQSDERGGTGAG
jgi:hypothetical protein